MLAYVTPAIVANDVRMQRAAQFDRAFAIVEGDADSKFYKKLFDPTVCSVVRAYSWENAIEVLSRLKGDNVPGIFAILDADFRRMAGMAPKGDVLWTDSHDLEMDLFSSPALERVIGEWCDEARVAKFCEGTTIRERLVGPGCKIGSLRWYSEREKINLKFDGMKLLKFVRKQTLEVDIREMVREIKNRSMRPELNEKTIAADVQDIVVAGHDPLQLCNGHDICEMLSIGLRAALGNRDGASEVTAATIEASLRMAYDPSWFSARELSASIGAWEEKNFPFRVLRK